jgi:hypothetical protein
MAQLTIRTVFLSDCHSPSPDRLIKDGRDRRADCVGLSDAGAISFLSLSSDGSAGTSSSGFGFTPDRSNFLAHCIDHHPPDIGGVTLMGEL